MMKVLFAVCVRFALFHFDGNFAAHAFTGSASRVLSRESPVIGNPMRSSDLKKHHHHMGDLDHDVLFEEESISNTWNQEEVNGDSPRVVVFDDAEVALDDATWDMAMKSIMALVVALAVAFGGGGLFKPRPVLAAEAPPMDVSRSAKVVVTRAATVPWNDWSPPSSLP